MIKYRLIYQGGDAHVVLFDTEMAAKKYLTHASGTIPSSKKINKQWEYFKTAGWAVQKVKATIEVID